MFFSVLVPVYNSLDTIHTCVDSALGQSFSALEVVLVDDGSTDGSAAACDSIQQAHPDRVRVIHQENGGLIAARRRGIQAARGDYCLFLDGDDAFYPGAMETIHRALCATNADMVIFTYADWYPERNALCPSTPVFEDERLFAGAEKKALYEQLIRSWRLNNLCCKCIRTDILKADPTDYMVYGKNPYTEDLLQTLYPVTEAQRIVYLASPLYQYRRRGDSISQKAEPGKLAQQLNTPVMEQLRAYMTRWDMAGQEQLNWLSARKMQGLTTLFWQYWRAAGNKAQRKALLWYPWEKHLTGEDWAYIKSGAMDAKQKKRLMAILEKKQGRLNWIVWLGTLKMRMRHGR